MTSKAKLLEAIQMERTHLESLLAPLSDEQLCSPTLEGGRSIKDILAHLAAWESRCMGWVETSLRGETPQRPEPGFTWADIDRLNERDYLESRDRPLPDVLADAQRTHPQLLAQVRSLSEEDLTDADKFAWTEGEQLAWFIGSNSFEHYHEHGDQIYDWLCHPQVEL